MSELLKPKYYDTESVYEPWKIIKYWKLCYHRGSAIAYILRAHLKEDYCKDLQKAITHLDQSIKDYKEEKNENS